MENLDPPPPLPPKSEVKNGAFWLLRGFILDLGGWGFAVPFYFVQDCSLLLFRSLPSNRVSVGLTDRRKTARNLVDSRKNWKTLTVSRKEGKKELTIKDIVP